MANLEKILTQEEQEEPEKPIKISEAYKNKSEEKEPAKISSDYGEFRGDVFEGKLNGHGIILNEN